MAEERQQQLDADHCTVAQESSTLSRPIGAATQQEKDLTPPPGMSVQRGGESSLSIINLDRNTFINGAGDDTYTRNEEDSDAQLSNNNCPPLVAHPNLNIEVVSIDSPRNLLRRE